MRDLRAAPGFDPGAVQALFEDPGFGVIPLVLVPRARFTTLFGGPVTMDGCDGAGCGRPPHPAHATLVFHPVDTASGAEPARVDLPLGDAAERRILARMARQPEVRFVMAITSGEPAQGGLMRVTFTGMGPRLARLIAAADAA